MADFSSTTHATYIPEMWADEVVAALEAKVVVADTVKTVTFGTDKNRGDILHFPQVSNLTVGDIAANADIVGEAPTESETTVTLNKFKHASIYIPKHLQKNLSKYDFRQEYTGKIGFALARQRDLDLLVTLETTSVTDIGVTGSSATDITDQMIRDAMEVFDEGDVPGTERTFILYPDQRSAILGIAKFVESRTIGTSPTPIVTGKVSGVYDNRVEMTTLITREGTTPHFNRKGIFLHKEGCVLASPEMGPDIEFVWIPRRKAWLLSGDLVYGSALYRTNLVIVINTDH